MNTADLMEALGAAEENDIEASAGELPAAASPRKPWLRWGAVAAACLCMIAASLLLRSGDRTNVATTMAPPQENRMETYPYDDSPQLTMQTLYMAFVSNPFLSLPEEIPLLTTQDWEIPQERQTLYFVASQREEEISGMFHMILEAAKMYRNAHPEVPRIESVYSPVFSLSPDGSPAEREWILPDVDMGRIRGIFTAKMPEGPGKIQIVYTKRDADSEDWIARLEGLAQYSSPESPVCFLRNEKIGLMGLVDEKAYLICPAKGDPFPPSSIAPAQYVPDDETLAVERLSLSGTGIPVRYHAELTPEQLARYKDILLSEEDHPYRVKYDMTGMSEEEIREYFIKVSNDQSPAVTAANYLDRNVTVSVSKDGLSVYREEYGGCYLWENRLCVLIPRQVEGAEAYLKSLFEEHFTDRVFFRSVEYSYNELLRFQKQEVLPALQENGIRLYMMGPDEAMNCVTASVSERDLVRCCELILEKGWVGRIRLERMFSPPAFTED